AEDVALELREHRIDQVDRLALAFGPCPAKPCDRLLHAAQGDAVFHEAGVDRIAVGDVDRMPAGGPGRMRLAARLDLPPQRDYQVAHQIGEVVLRRHGDRGRTGRAE